MASAGNPNQPSAPFDVHMLFKPPPNSGAVPGNPGNPASNPPFPPSISYPVPSPGPFSYPPQTAPFHQHSPHPFLHYAQDPLANVYPQQARPAMPYGSPIPNPSQCPSPNSGARLMALLGTPAPISLETATSMPPPSSLSSASSGDISLLSTAPSAPTMISPGLPPTSSSRLPSSKQPHGRLITRSDHFLYDVDVKGSSPPPQLEVAPITKYTSDPGLVFGRQIAVNRSYICYGLRQGSIRVLNINTALRSLLRGHTQRVTDMAFFAEDVHLLASASVDGRIFVWKISEGPGKDNKPEITGKIVIAIQVVSDEDSFHPLVCWHSHKQEILIVGIGNCLLRIDMTKVGKGDVMSEDEPLQCNIDKLIDGVQLIGKHDQEVTDLSMSQWMMTRLASSSKDGTVKIWDERKATPLATLRPHDSHPVNCVSFLTAPHRPDHILLITAGLLNREVKIWASANQEGWLLPSDCESWQCMQTLELTSSLETRVEDAFFNQVVVLPQASLILLANAKKNTIYAVHVDYGENPLSTRMDYVAEFSVKMPILSLTATSDCYADNKHVIQVYCVQTQAIQQYALDLSLCLPPLRDNVAVEKELSVSRVSDAAMSDSFASPVAGITTVSREPSGSKISLDDSSASPITDLEAEISQPVDSDLLPSIEYMVDQSASSLSVDKVLESGPPDLPEVSPDERKPETSDISMIPNLPKFTHLVTPSEILSKVVSETETRIPEVGPNLVPETAEVEVKVVGEAGLTVNEEPDSQREPQIRTLDDKSMSLSSQVKESNTESAGEVALNFDKVVNVEDNVEQTTTYLVKDEVKDESEKISLSGDSTQAMESVSMLKGKKQKSKQSQISESSFVPDSINEHENRFRVLDSGSLHALANIQEMLNQVLAIQKNMQNQMNAAVSIPVTKEGKRVEVALGRCIEKAIKANNDVLWARFQEEIAKREKQEKERMQQISILISNTLNKDLPSVLEKSLKKENSSLGPSLARSISPLLEKAVSSAIVDAFQKGVGDKAVNQLEKSVNSKLEATVARQIQAQFQTSAKQYLQEGMRSCLESSIIPSFELACKSMFEQIDAGFHKGMVEHTTAVQQQLESAHSPLALSLRDAINSALAVTQTLSNEVVDGQRKLLSVVAAGNPKLLESRAALQANGPLREVEPPLDPTKELTRLITDRKFDEAFTAALQRSDVSIVSWLCSQVDLQGLCSMSPLPLSQGVLLSLLQQLACDLGNDTTQKLAWMTQVAVAILPSDPMIALHVRPIFDQVYQILMHQRSLPTTTPADSNSIRLMLHVINSVLTGFK